MPAAKIYELIGRTMAKLRCTVSRHHSSLSSVAKFFFFSLCKMACTCVVCVLYWANVKALINIDYSVCVCVHFDGDSIQCIMYIPCTFHNTLTHTHHTDTFHHNKVNVFISNIFLISLFFFFLHMISVHRILGNFYCISFYFLILTTHLPRCLVSIVCCLHAFIS